MSDTARIHTKLTADGSELTRALGQGISKASDFKGQMANLGKTIGAAFTGAAVIRSLQLFAQGQVNAAKGFQQLSKDADAFSVTLENLAEKLNAAGLGEGKNGVGRVLTDYRQAIRGLAVDLKNLQEIEGIGGPAGFMKSIEDSLEVLMSGKLQTVDEAKIQQMQEQLEDLGKAYDKAQKRAEKLVRDHESSLRESLAQFDFQGQVASDIESGNVTALQAYKEAADEVASTIRDAFESNPSAGFLEDMKESLNMSRQMGKALEDIRKTSEKRAFDWQMQMIQMDREAQASQPARVGFAASLEKIGGGNFGAVAPPSAKNDNTQKLVDLVRQEIPLLKGILDGVKEFQGGLF